MHEFDLPAASRPLFYFLSAAYSVATLWDTVPYFLCLIARYLPRVDRPSRGVWLTAELNRAPEECVLTTDCRHAFAILRKRVQAV